MNELRQVSIEGFSEQKLQSFGHIYTAAIKEYLLKHNLLLQLKDALAKNPIPGFTLSPTVRNKHYYYYYYYHLLTLF